jgi:aspartate racemase
MSTHYAYSEITKASSVPILDLIEITALACKKANLKKVAILGTIATMTDGLYKNKIEEKGMSLVIPTATTCDAINAFIMDEIVPGRVNEQTRLRVLKLIQAIECDGFILGCTELPEVYNSAELGKTAVDTTRLIAEVAFNIAMTEDRQLMMSYVTHN